MIETTNVSISPFLKLVAKANVKSAQQEKRDDDSDKN